MKNSFNHHHIFGNKTGFTLIEVVVTLVILTILGAYVIVRYTDDKNVAPTVESVKAFIRYAQSQSMNSSNLWGIQCSGNQISLFKDSVANQATLPGENTGTLDLTRRDIDSISNFVVYFDNWGVPYTGTPVAKTTANELNSDMTVSINGTYTITITAKTGYVP